MVGQTGDAVAQHPTGSMTAARSAPGDSLRSRTGPVNWQLRSDQRERHYSLWNTSLGGRLFLCRQRFRTLGRGPTGSVGTGLGRVRGILLGLLRGRLLGLDGDRSPGAGGGGRLFGVGDRIGAPLRLGPGPLTLRRSGPGRLGRGLRVLRPARESSRRPVRAPAPRAGASAGSEASCSACCGAACAVSTGIAPPAPAAAAACSASATGSEPRSGSAPGPSPSDGPFPDGSDEDCSSSGRALSDEACSEAEACASEPDSRLSSTPMACPSTVTSGWDWLLDAAAIEAIVARARARLSASSSRRWTSLPFSSEESPSCSFPEPFERERRLRRLLEREESSPPPLPWVCDVPSMSTCRPRPWQCSQVVEKVSTSP